MMGALLKAEKLEEDGVVIADAGRCIGSSSNNSNNGNKHLIENIRHTSIRDEEDREEEGELADDEESMTEEDLHDSGIGPLLQASIGGTTTTPFKAKRSKTNSGKETM